MMFINKNKEIKYIFKNRLDIKDIKKINNDSKLFKNKDLIIKFIITLFFIISIMVIVN